MDERGVDGSGCIDNVRNVCASMTRLTNCLFVF